MRVVVHLDGATVRGNERQARLIARGLRRRGHDVVVACRRTGPVRAYMAEADLPTAGVRPRGDLDVISLLRFTLWLRRVRPDALLLTSWKRAFTAGLAGRLARVPRIVQRLGGPHPVRRGLRGAKQRLALTWWPHAIIVNSEGLRDQVLAELPALPADRVRVVASGIDAAAYAAVEPAERAPGLPALATGAVLLLAVGGLEPLKGYDALIERLPELGDDVHLAVVGGGSGERRAALEGLALRAGVSGRVHFLGQRPPSEVPALLAAADVFVHPSRVDSLPNAVMEAMAAGLPIVAAAVPGMAEALEGRPGRQPAGWVVPRDDAEALTVALAEVVEAVRAGEGYAGARGAEARWRAANLFSVDRMLDGYEAVMEKAEG